MMKVKKFLKTIVIILLVLCLLFLFLVSPRMFNKPDMSAFMGANIAHRGYFDNEAGIPENSLSCFQAAIDKGFAIELDIQLSSDGVAMVFHDADLERMCGVEGKIWDYTAAELQEMKLFGTEYVHQRVRRQINTYISDYNYSYSGIQRTLTYFYEIKGNSLDKANGGIGIVPYVYQDAYNYYYALWEAGQKNQNKNISDFVPKEKVITISPPQRKLKKRKLFTFLDEEEMNE